MACYHSSDDRTREEQEFDQMLEDDYQRREDDKFMHDEFQADSEELFVHEFLNDRVQFQNRIFESMKKMGAKEDEYLGL